MHDDGSNVVPIPSTRYFREVVLLRRPYLRPVLADIASIRDRPIAEAEQDDGRFRRWGWAGTMYLRVVVLDDRVTIHNAFPDDDAREG